MENIAHTLCGLRIADLGFRDDLKRAAPWVAVIAANIPDADSVVALFGREVYLSHHRGITHSFFGWPFLALIGAFVSHRISKTSTWSRHLQLWSLCLISHQLLDWITAWGTMMLWPIKTRFALDTTFIVDPVFWVILGVLPYLWRRRLGWDPQTIGRRSLLVFVSWIFFCMIMRQQAQSFAPRDSQVFAAPLAPLFWTGLSSDGQQIERYWLTPWSSEPAGVFLRPTREQEERLRKDPLAGAILQMSNAIVLEPLSDGRVKIWDLSFTSWLDPDRMVIGGEFVLPPP